MYEVVGHHAVREALRSYDGFLAVVGPSGVGKRGIVAEWLAGRPAEPFHAKVHYRPDITYLVDGDKVHDWSKFVAPLERAALRIAIVACSLPTTIESRIGIFRVGLLSEVEVTQVLARDFPMLQPRPVIARIAQGSLADIEFKAETAKTFETLDQALADGTMPNLRKHRPLAVYAMLVWAARAVVGLPSLSFQPSARAFLSSRTALAILSLPTPEDDHSARNMLSLLFSQSVHG